MVENLSCGCTMDYLNEAHTIYKTISFCEIHAPKTVLLSDLKQSKIAEIKKSAYDIIINQYPLWKQCNIIREGGTNLTTMSTFIDGIRVEVDLLEIEVNDLTTNQAVLDFTYTIGG